MIILDKKDYTEVKKMITAKEYNTPTFVHSILDEYIEGTVYANSIELHTILIGTKSGIYYAMGNESNEKFNQTLVEFYWHRKFNNLRFTLFSSTDNWDRTLKKLLKDKITQLKRLSFSYEKNKISQVINFPSDKFSIKEIDEEVITSSMEFNKDYYTEYWGTITNFSENGFGFCILHKGQVVSECTSIFYSDTLIELDIVTHKEYRGLGLATIIGKAFIDHSFQKNLIPRWDCDVSNISSIKLAQKLGFREPKEYSVFI